MRARMRAAHSTATGFASGARPSTWSWRAWRQIYLYFEESCVLPPSSLPKARHCSLRKRGYRRGHWVIVFSRGARSGSLAAMAAAGPRRSLQLRVRHFRDTLRRQNRLLFFISTTHLAVVSRLGLGPLRNVSRPAAVVYFFPISTTSVVALLRRGSLLRYERGRFADEVAAGLLRGLRTGTHGHASRFPRMAQVVVSRLFRPRDPGFEGNRSSVSLLKPTVLSPFPP